MAYDKELTTAVQAVRAAAMLCRTVQARLVSSDTLEKQDNSPVTVADFAAQAVVCAHLQQAFPNDVVVGEEDAADLGSAQRATLRRSVVRYVGEALEGEPDEAEVLDWINRGNGDAVTDRYWTLDPIDGTKGFLRGEQYAIALALIERGEVVLGVLGCPNLAMGDHSGVLLQATRPGRTEMAPLDAAQQTRPVQVSQLLDVGQARFCESVEAAHSNQNEAAQIAALLGIRSEPYRIDSQCKYAAVARGDASIYLRLPTRADYREKIWDHAAGKLIVEAAGGTVTDINGKALDFSVGRYLDANNGVVATGGAIHDEVIAAIETVRAGLE